MTISIWRIIIPTKNKSIHYPLKYNCSESNEQTTGILCVLDRDYVTKCKSGYLLGAFYYQEGR